MACVAIDNIEVLVAVVIHVEEDIAPSPIRDIVP